MPRRDAGPSASATWPAGWWPAARTDRSGQPRRYKLYGWVGRRYGYDADHVRQVFNQLEQDGLVYLERPTGWSPTGYGRHQVGQVVRYDVPPGWQAFVADQFVDGGPWPRSEDAQVAFEATWTAQGVASGQPRGPRRRRARERGMRRAWLALPLLLAALAGCGGVRDAGRTGDCGAAKTYRAALLNIQGVGQPDGASLVDEFEQVQAALDHIGRVGPGPVREAVRSLQAIAPDTRVASEQEERRDAGLTLETWITADCGLAPLR